MLDGYGEICRAERGGQRGDTGDTAQAACCGAEGAGAAGAHRQNSVPTPLAAAATAAGTATTAAAVAVCIPTILAVHPLCTPSRSPRHPYCPRTHSNKLLHLLLPRPHHPSAAQHLLARRRNAVFVPLPPPVERLEDMLLELARERAVHVPARGRRRLERKQRVLQRRGAGARAANGRLEERLRELVVGARL